MGFAIVEWAERKNGVTAYIQTIEVAPEARAGALGASCSAASKAQRALRALA